MLSRIATRPFCCKTSSAAKSTTQARRYAKAPAGGFFRNCPPVKVSTQTVGEFETAEYRQFFQNHKQDKISPWHDIPLYSGDKTSVETGELVLNYICEMPRGTNQKMEMATDEEWNPIKQDTKKGKLRYIKWSPMLFNYGFAPRTWEDPNLVHPELKLKGDGDPVDIVDIGRRPCMRGEVVRARVLGALAMIDEGELDWKVIVCNIDDPVVRDLTDPKAVENFKPGAFYAVVEYFRNYKVPDGKPLNTFGYGEQFLDKDHAYKVLDETNEMWANLVKNPVDKFVVKSAGEVEPDV